ncbi:FAD-dependent monooxygenase sorC [Colletotrichum spaethianum]|uniref:FAD-dependent monooxygenase sorC n=1 Tax=Colletotrichum spaethianum TaxID=700344 RepID=A0AA37NU17_9PEZI|nr:FAD-dependent monooxygenase sorC [Colletotrichum spaethianum]GKT41557.1 FAD-dependent monooxygenase sorC [Colletotrichum spaethianum]
MSSTKKSFEVAIVGGGIAGMILAISLIKRNVPCIIYEKAHAFTEQGVGLGMTPNAVRAMQFCDPAVREAFEKVTEPPFQWDFLDGTNETNDSITRFSLGNTTIGLRGCHRGQFLRGLVELVPESMIRFKKQLERVEEHQGASGKLTLVFSDGTTAETDAVIGCDGIKSHTRGIVVGHDHPSVKCTYSQKYAYRGLIPMSQAIEILGPERAKASGQWVIQALKGLDRWGQFDLGDHPPPTYAKGRICLLGDAAHATTPHQGAGGGICIEDAAVMASLLAEDGVRCSADLEAAFATFDEHRRERGEWLIKSSRRAGELYQLQSEHGKDFQKLEAEIQVTSKKMWNFDIELNIQKAVRDLNKRLTA